MTPLEPHVTKEEILYTDFLKWVANARIIAQDFRRYGLPIPKTIKKVLEYKRKIDDD